MKRLLLIGDPNSIYVQNYALQLRKHFGSSISMDLFATFISNRKPGSMPYDHIHGIIDSGHIHTQGKSIRWLRPWYLFQFLRSRQAGYDVVHVLYCIQDLLFARIPLRKAAPRLILTVFGSDFYQLAEWKKRWFRQVYQSADIITSNNNMALDAIRHLFDLRPERMKICRFGFNSLDLLERIKNTPQSVSREHLQLPSGKIIICIGYNYDSIQQHIPVLQSISSNPDLLRHSDDLFFLVPMTYGTEPRYRNELKEALTHFPIPHATIEYFLSDEENAHLRKAPDILIQVQKSDSFSASTQEHMFAGNLLITGDWLPYRDLEESGIYFRKVGSPRETGDELLYCIEHLSQEKEKCNQNPDAIYKLSSWNVNIPHWLELYA